MDVQRHTLFHRHRISASIRFPAAAHDARQAIRRCCCVSHDRRTLGISYAIVGFFYPQSYMIVGQPGRLVYADALYLSITCLLYTSFGDVTPLTRPARGVCMIEQIAGALFVAIL